MVGVDQIEDNKLFEDNEGEDFDEMGVVEDEVEEVN